MKSCLSQEVVEAKITDKIRVKQQKDKDLFHYII